MTLMHPVGILCAERCKLCSKVFILITLLVRCILINFQTQKIINKVKLFVIIIAIIDARNRLPYQTLDLHTYHYNE